MLNLTYEYSLAFLKFEIKILIMKTLYPFFFLIIFNLPCHIGRSQSFSKGSAQYGLPVLPGVSGFGLDAVGGKGGKIIIVNNLNSEGKGSLAEALDTDGPRIIVFEVAGVIDLGGKSLRIRKPFVTIAGQTAPSPGITLIKGGLGISTHEVIVQHIKVRPGEAGHAKKSGWEVDGIATTGGASNVIIDHCSATWATDENLSASGPRFDGKNIDEWRKNTSNKVTISNCIIAFGLSNSTHAKGEHSKGTLIHDNATEILVYGNLYANNVDRHPLCKGGSQTVIVNNYIYNPVRAVFHYALNAGEWTGYDWVTGKMNVEGNYVEYGPNTSERISAGNFTGPVEVYWKDNLVTPKGKGREFNGNPVFVDNRTLWPKGLIPLPATKVKDQVLNNAGAFPWDRDEIDQKIIDGIRSGGGKIIDSENEVGGYPTIKPVYRKFNPKDWDLETMTKKNGLP
jgi:pectate lyase